MPEVSPLSSAIASAVLIVVVLLGRWIIAWRIRRSTETLTHEQWRWLSLIRNVAIILLLLGLALIWSAQISAFALSITAFAVALVIATKELILNLSGGIYVWLARPFEIGDWIHWQGHRGEVVERGWASTRLLELGDAVSPYRYTGRSLVLPNSAVLTATIENENFRRNYVYHEFQVTLPAGTDPSPARPGLEALLAEEAQGYADVARRYWETIRRRTQTDLPQPSAKVTVGTSDLGHVRVRANVFCPVASASRIEAAATRYLLTRFAKHDEPGLPTTIEDED